MIVMNRKISQKLLAVFMLTIILFTVIVPAAMADESIMDKVNKAQGEGTVSQLEEKASSAGDAFVKFLRNIAIIVAVIMFVLVAYALLFSPDVRTIADCKGKVGALVLAIAIAVMAEEIVGTLLSWLK